jgi:hypothetical protein
VDETVSGSCPVAENWNTEPSIFSKSEFVSMISLSIFRYLRPVQRCGSTPICILLSHIFMPFLNLAYKLSCRNSSVGNVSKLRKGSEKSRFLSRQVQELFSSSKATRPGLGTEEPSIGIESSFT